jgi:hypothetical protein
MFVSIVQVNDTDEIHDEPMMPFRGGIDGTKMVGDKRLRTERD